VNDKTKTKTADGAGQKSDRAATNAYVGEQLAQKRFGVEAFWAARDFDAMFHRTIPAGVARFIEALPFFFIATANARGECDCSFRGRDYDADGEAYPLLKVLDANMLVFPDYRGNNFFNSLGNILVNGQIGMLFLDFETRTRVRINGLARILDEAQRHADIWPLAQRYVHVTVAQVFGNCRSRIPRMRMIDAQDGE
jgi:predicted pyridoxine 5'-phosphate oxidase superfamily flavin-nucleotide-binding protein